MATTSRPRRLDREAAMQRPLVALILALAAHSGRAAADPATFHVARVVPPNGAEDVGTDPLIQVHTSEKFDPRSVDRRAISLVGPDGKPVPVVLTPDLGGVITVSAE